MLDLFSSCRHFFRCCWDVFKVVGFVELFQVAAPLIFFLFVDRVSGLLDFGTLRHFLETPVSSPQTSGIVWADSVVFTVGACQTVPHANPELHAAWAT